MVHDINSPWLKQTDDKCNSYSSRYSADWHCYLIEQLSDCGASALVKLNEVCSVFGLPSKFGVDGSKVFEIIDHGKIQDVQDYCKTNILNTYLVYLRVMMHRGDIDLDGYNRCVSDVITMIEAESNERQHLSAFLDAWVQSPNNQFTMVLKER